MFLIGKARRVGYTYTNKHVRSSIMWYRKHFRKESIKKIFNIYSIKNN